jgi:hypothetical protein
MPKMPKQDAHRTLFLFLLAALVLSAFALARVPAAAQQPRPGAVTKATPTPTPTPKSTPTPTPTPTPAVGCRFGPVPATPHFYFGYLNDACDGLEYVLPQTAAETNSAWSNRTADLTPAGIASAQIEDLCAASQTGRKCVLEIDELAFNGALLRSDWQSRVDQWAGILTQYSEYIAAIYPLDEPMERASLAGVPSATMFANLSLVTTRLKSWFPATPLAVIMQSFTLSQNLPLPANYDWLGFDFYSDFTSGGQGVVHFEDILEARLTSSQRAILVPFAWANPGTVGQQIDRTQQATLYYDLTLNRPKIIGVFPFLFQSVDQGTSHASGVRDIPALHAIFQTISQDLRSR